MDIKKRLDEIWGADYLNALSPEAKTVLERGYVFYNNEERKDLLITGINPSFREEEVKVGLASIPQSYWRERLSMMSIGLL